MEPGKHRYLHAMNDPRITSYALGELSGREREEFERELADSESLQQSLAETIQLADALAKIPASEETLTDESRTALRRECARNVGSTQRKANIIRFVSNTAALAAVVTLVVGVSALVLSTSGYIQKKAARSVDNSGESGMVVAMPPLQEAVVGSPPQVVVSGPAAMSFTPAQPVTMAPAQAEVQYEANVLAYQQPMTPELKASMEEASARAQIEAGVLKAPSSSTPSVASLAPPQSPVATVSANEVTVARASKIAAFTGGRGKEEAFSSGNRAAAKSDSRASGATVFQGARRGAPNFNTEAYDAIQENVFLKAKDNPLSTFSIDVDTASYANVRRFLQNDQVPPPGAIRTEELINYFTYSYPQPEGEAPFSVNLEVSRAPWDVKRELVRIGLKGKEIPASERGPANLVFLLDVSGSMDEPSKLPLLKRSLSELVENLSPKDRVAIVVYAGSSGLILPSTPGTEKPRILEALDNLKAGGGTNGGEGIRLAYNTAREHFLKEGNNRVILCTDGDFNLGTTNQSELVKLIEQERASGVFLSVLGFGSGNLKDSTMEKLADKGNGNYAYIDSLSEGRKVLVEQMGATLFTIAKDVKIQVEFNPARVAGYRLIGYENRLLAKEDFNDDRKDAGEIGAGHAVTALYEIIPAGQPLPDQATVDPLKYQPVPPASVAEPSSRKASPELLTLKLRYKAPDGDKSKLIEMPLTAPEIPAFEKASADFQFAAAVAAFGMKLRGSPTAGEISLSDIQKIVRRTLGEDPGSYRAEFLTLIEKASRMTEASSAASKSRRDE
jgi:Ca-activated chloride channel family protein